MFKKATLTMESLMAWYTEDRFLKFVTIILAMITVAVLAAMKVIAADEVLNVILALVAGVGIGSVKGNKGTGVGVLALIAFLGLGASGCAPMKDLGQGILQDTKEAVTVGSVCFIQCSKNCVISAVVDIIKKDASWEETGKCEKKCAEKCSIQASQCVLNE